VLVQSDVEVPLTLSCAELGTYAYTLMLTSTPAGPERGLVFNVPLGSKAGGSIDNPHSTDVELTNVRAFTLKSSYEPCSDLGSSV